MDKQLRTVNLGILTMAVALLGTSGCRVVGGIFKAGIWTGLIGIGLLLAVVFGLTRLFSRGARGGV